MRAMAYDAYGSDDVLTLCDLPDPKVGPGEVRIRVRRAGVNPVDWKVMSGGLDGLMDVVFPVVPGWDVAGTVETVGIDTPEFEVGDDLVADLELRGVDADRLDRAGDVPAGDHREHDVHQAVETAGHHLPVDRVHPRSPHPDTDLAWADLGVGQLTQGQNVVGSVRVVRHGSHG